VFTRLAAALVGAACTLALAQTPPPVQTEAADQASAEARDIYSQQGPRAALPNFEHALSLYRKAGDRRGEAITLGHLGNCYKRLGDLPRALDYLQRALAMKRELGDRLEEGKTLSHLGLVYWEMGDYKQAIEQLTRSISLARELGDQKLEAAALNNLSLVYDEQGDYQRSLEQYRRALELHRATNFAAGESATLGNIGGVYLLLGRFREASRYYQQALAISERLNLKPSASQDLGNLALCQLGLGEVTEATSTFDRALALAQRAGLKKEEADWLKGKGGALFRLGKYNLALEAFRQALHVYEQAGLKREHIEALNELGNLHLLLGDPASAEREFRRAIELARAIGHPRGVTTNLLALGNLEWRRKRYEEAAAVYREALARAREAGERDQMAASHIQLALTYREQGRLPEAHQEADAALKLAQELGTRLLEAEALHALGEVERRQGQFEAALEHYAAGEEIAGAVGEPELSWRLAYGRGQALEGLNRNEDAVAAYKRAVTIIEGVRSQLREERFRAGYIEDKYQVYVSLVHLLLKLGRAGEAFLFSEKLRARSYLDLFLRGQPPIRSVADRQTEIELHQRIRQLQRAIDEESAQPPAQQRHQALEIFAQELAAAERTYQNLLDDLRRQEPAYAAARALTVPSTDEVQQFLPAHAALIEYVMAEDSVSIFVLTAEELQAKTLPVRAVDLRAKVELLRDLILREKSNEWRKPAESLDRILIEPVSQAGWLDGVERLYLVPHGILHYLPFAALLRPSLNGIRFLMEDYAIAYLPAAAALVHGSSAADSERTLLAMAPARARLQWARQEARSIREFFPRERLLLVGNRATESRFKREASHYQVIHLATHGFFNRLNPLLSGVVLEPDRQDDGRLEVHEILGLRLKARLVTLSACDTALASGYFADVPAGDDFVGLTRAFLYAGSPSVLASLWEVDDLSTLRLMRSFYRHLEKSGKACALAEAQRELRTGRYRHPYFWAPFVLVGAM
jgi:CHAT domain-containing protein/Tfp pilus assembly protein PilF